MLPSMSTRSDLDYLLGELGGEVSVGHAYVQPGNEPAPKRIEGGLLGAEIEADPSGYFRVAHIFPGENWHADFRSPLTEPGVHVEKGTSSWRSTASPRRASTTSTACWRGRPTGWSPCW